MSELNFIWSAIWQELTNHAAVILLYFQKIKRLRLTFFFWLLYSLFLHPENARNVVQGNPKTLKFSRGSMPPDSPTSLYLYCPNAPSTKNPGYAPVISLTLLSFWQKLHAKSKMLSLLLLITTRNWTLLEYKHNVPPKEISNFAGMQVITGNPSEICRC